LDITGLACVVSLSSAHDDSLDQAATEQALQDALPTDADLAPGYQWNTTWFDVGR
jgi:hypothetical protein